MIHRRAVILFLGTVIISVVGTAAVRTVRTPVAAQAPESHVAWVSETLRRMLTVKKPVDQCYQIHSAISHQTFVNGD